jgi:hypothetical protein
MNYFWDYTDIKLAGVGFRWMFNDYYFINFLKIN